MNKLASMCIGHLFSDNFHLFYLQIVYFALLQPRNTLWSLLFPVWHVSCHVQEAQYSVKTNCCFTTLNTFAWRKLFQIVCSSHLCLSLGSNKIWHMGQMWASSPPSAHLILLSPVLCEISSVHRPLCCLAHLLFIFADSLNFLSSGMFIKALTAVFDS